MCRLPTLAELQSRLLWKLVLEVFFCLLILLAERQGA